MDERERFVAAIRNWLAQENMSVRAAAMRSGIPVRSFQGIMDGQQPSIGRAAEICEALDIDFRIGPPHSMESISPYVDMILRAARESGRSERDISRAATGQPTAIAMLKTGTTPSAERVRQFCNELNLEFYVGPPRGELVSPPHESGEAEQRPTWADDLFEKVEDLRLEMDRTSGTRSDFVTTGGDVETRYIEVVEVGAAAGDGQDAGLDTVTGRLAFRADWLKRHRLDPEQCRVIGVADESMESTLPNGCSILVDMARKRLRTGRIFVVRSEYGLLVKRAVRDGRKWILESEHSAWEPLPWPRGAEVIGEVRWMARTFL